MHKPHTVGASIAPTGVTFRVWALGHSQVEVVLFEDGQECAAHPMQPDTAGYFTAFVPGGGAGTRYKFRVDGEGPFPDPASRSQPDGVHGPSAVVDLSFGWQDEAWQGLPMDQLVIYELHVGAATAEGTFEALIPRLAEIKSLGATAIELMPVADFPGARNWGYDGVCLWAPTHVYGGYRGLQRLVDAAHTEELAVILDVVYNHLGPDGNYLRAYACDYFTERHKTPWGEALNFDGPNARPVRDFFLGNALAWLHDFHLDGLRLDATHEIKDESDPHFLAELSALVHASLPSGRHIVLIAENECNDPSLMAPLEAGGLGLDGIWADDFHHQVRRALAGDHEGYYAPYTGTMVDIARTLQRGWFFERQYRSTPPPASITTETIPHPAFVHCIQNHDQIGNRALGDRLHHTIDLAAYRAASALLLLDPATPLIFMGQEWATTSPFLFFTDHNPELGQLVTEGRRAEFAGFSAFRDEATRDKIPDPQALETFQRSKLNWAERALPDHAGILTLYRDLLRFRHNHPTLNTHHRPAFEVAPLPPHALVTRRTHPESPWLLLVVNLRGPLTLELHRTALASKRQWRLIFSSEAPQYGGSGTITDTATSIQLDGPAALLFESLNA